MCVAKMSAFKLTQDEIMSACAPISGNLRAGSLLAPLLHDILALLSVRGEERLEYYTCFILTDGVISDIENAMKVSHPVSYTIIGNRTYCSQSRILNWPSFPHVGL